MRCEGGTVQRPPEAVLLMVVREDHIQEVLVLDVLDPVCIKPSFLEIKNVDNRF
jgi:hypothetical protein